MRRKSYSPVSPPKVKNGLLASDWLTADALYPDYLGKFLPSMAVSVCGTVRSWSPNRENPVFGLQAVAGTALSSERGRLDVEIGKIMRGFFVCLMLSLVSGLDVYAPPVCPQAAPLFSGRVVGLAADFGVMG